MSDEIQQMRERMDRNERAIDETYIQLKWAIERERIRLNRYAHVDAAVKIGLVIFVAVAFWVLWK
jgi:hypothetical protein